jgi:hypothetical protein
VGTAVSQGTTKTPEPLPKTLPGVVCAQRVRCGKPGCCCAQGLGHLAYYRFWREGGRLRKCYVSRADLAALRADGKPEWKNDDATREKIRTLDKKHGGPIVMPEKQGSQPRVAKDALLRWWNGLREHFTSRVEEAEAEAESARLTISETHEFGRTGTVVPGVREHGV